MGQGSGIFISMNDSHSKDCSTTSTTSPSRFWILTAAAIFAAAGTAGLGVWQNGRGHDKDALAERIATAPLVTLHGRWLGEHTVYLDNRPMGGRTGFYVITPLYVPEQNTVVVVERGWVPRDFKQRDLLPAVDTPTGEVKVIGRRVNAPSRLFQLDSRPETGVLRQNLDLSQYQKQIGQSVEARALRETSPDSQGLIRNWDNPASGSAKNYAYAVQWFAFSVLILGLYFWYMWIQPKRQSKRQSKCQSKRNTQDNS